MESARLSGGSGKRRTARRTAGEMGGGVQGGPLTMSRLPLSISVALLLSLAAIAGSLVEAASPTQKVVFSFAGVNERYGCLFVAKDQQLFEEQGLAVQIVQMRNGPIAISAMAGGDATFYTASAP